MWYSAATGNIIAQPFVAPNMTKEQVEDILRPMLSRLDAAGSNYTRSHVTTSPSFGALDGEL